MNTLSEAVIKSNKTVIPLCIENVKHYLLECRI
jgi:hypothetical protein